MTFEKSGDIIEKKEVAMNLLAETGNWIPDVVFFAILFLGLLFGVMRGFVKGICKLAGTIFAIVFGVAFCMPMKNSLDSTFGLTEALGGTTVAGWISVVISFIALVVIIKFGAWLVGKLGSALIDKAKPIKVVDKILGGLLGLAKALLVIFILLAILKWIGAEAIDEFIAQTTVLKGIYNSEWFATAFTLPL